MYLPLLTLELGAQGGVLGLKIGKAPNISTVRRSHYMGEHMDFAEDAFDELFRGETMAQRRPIGAGNIPSGTRFLPLRSKSFLASSGLEAVDTSLMFTIEELLQQFG